MTRRSAARICACACFSALTSAGGFELIEKVRSAFSTATREFSSGASALSTRTK